MVEEVMSLTTLVTFFFKTERNVVSVELLGSWDSFKKSYSMERDSKLGRGHWRGCHSITDIICDGETASASGSRREAGLLEGGTYWYYYRLNHETEVHDASRPSTTACPFLPGQQVNLLEVPMQLTEDGHQPASDPSMAITLEPADRFAALKSQTVNPRRNPQRFDASTSSSRRPSSRDSTSRPRTALKFSCSVDETPELQNRIRARSADPFASSLWMLEEPLRPYSTGAMPDHWESEDFSHALREIAEIEEAHLEEKPDLQMSHTRRLSVALERLELTDSVHDFGSGAKDEHAPKSLQAFDFGSPLPDSRKAATQDSVPQPLETAAVAEVSFLDNREMDGLVNGLQHTFSVTSSRTSAFFSSLTSDSELDEVDSRPQRKSPPRTPTRSDFGEVMVTTTWATPEHHRAFGSPEQLNKAHMNVYSLSEADTASALTLQNLETATVKSTSGDSPVLESGGRRRIVEAWNDGNEHRRTALQELVDEMGYLGSLIG